MGADAELVLAPPAPPGLVAGLSRIPGVRVRRDDTRSYLRYGAHEWDLRLLPRSAVDDPGQVERLTRREVEGDQQPTLPLVVATSLPRSLRRELAERRISYADARGHIHLRASGLFLYVDVPTEAAKAPPSGRTSGIGLVGIRAVQVLVTTPDRDWTVAELATESDVSSGEAHKVLTLLEREGLIEARGQGPAKRRRVRDPGSILDWLATQPRARRVYRHLTCSLYARTPADLARRVSRSLDAAEIPHAFTASLAAMLLSSGPTSVPRSVLRVDPNRSLEEVAAALGAEVTERGANLTLWSDDGLVGTHGRIRHEDTWLAPPARVYLDLLADRRGSDAAAHFREVALGA
jgi:hypothetical protein